MKLYGNSNNKNGHVDSSSPDRQKSAGKRGKVFLLIGISVLAVILAVWALLSAVIKPPSPEKIASPAQSIDQNSSQPATSVGYKKDFYTVLLVGTDESEFNADVIMIAAYDKANGKLNVVSIPRDTMVDVSRTNKKINASYGVGKGKTDKVSDGIAGLNSSLETVIGFSPDYYCVVRFEGFKKLVDKIGGVEFDVPQDMYKSDPYINLKKGQQKLDGDKALQLVRYRDYPMGDLKRIETAQAFLKATAKQMISITNLPKLPELVGIISDNLSSDLSTGEMIWFGTEILKLDSEDDINFYTLPDSGTGMYNGQSYVFLDEEEVVKLVNDTINPYTEPITADNLDIIKLTGSKASSKKSSSSSPSPTVKPSATPKASSTAEPKESEKVSASPGTGTSSPKPSSTSSTSTKETS